MRRFLAARRSARDERGFTLVELVMTITIMGLVITPLSMAMIQALTLIPTSGARTQTATDGVRLQSALVSDISQAQGMDWIGFYPGSAAPLPIFAEATPTSWVGGYEWANIGFTCQAGTSVMFDTWGSDGLTSSGGVKTPNTSGNPEPDTMYFWELWKTAYGSGQKVEVHREVSTDGGATKTDLGPFMTGYCLSTDAKPAVVTASQSNDGGYTQQSLNVTFNLRPSMSDPVHSTVLQAVARPSGITDIGS